MNTTLFQHFERLACASWRKSFEGLQMIVGHLMKVVLVIFDGPTKEVSIAAFLFAKSVLRLQEGGGGINGVGTLSFGLEYKT